MPVRSRSSASKLREPALAVAGKLAQLVDLGMAAGADVARQRACGAAARRPACAAMRSATSGSGSSADGQPREQRRARCRRGPSAPPRRAPERRGQADQVARSGRARPDPAHQALEVADAAERLAQRRRAPRRRRPAPRRRRAGRRCAARRAAAPAATRAGGAPIGVRVSSSTQSSEPRRSPRSVSSSSRLRRVASSSASRPASA